MSVASVVSVSLTIISALVALCFLNRPRFWWQESICNLSLYLVPLLGASLILHVKQLLSGKVKRVVSALGALASGYCLCAILSASVPFLWYPRWSSDNLPSVGDLRLVFIDDCHISQSEAHELLKTRAPNVVVVMGSAREVFLAEGTSLATRRDFGDRGEITVLTSLDTREIGVPNLGFRAMPGGVIGVKLSGGATVDLGVIGLRPSTTRSDFERNRISARRLSSYMRNSEATRLVVGSFYSTPFSQFVSVFTSQARMRSVWYGKGIVKTYDMDNVVSRFPFSHVLVSRDLRPISVERLTIPGCARAGFFVNLSATF